MGKAMKCELPFVQAYQDRYGKRRHYFRRKGHARVALPGEPGSPEFLAAYQAAMAVDKPKPTTAAPIAGSFKALCHEYEKSADFLAYADSTRREMGYVIKALVKQHGAKPVALLEKRHIHEWKDALARKPGAANKMLRTVKALLAFAVDREYRKDNPAAGMKLLRVGRWRAWTDEELIAFEAKHPLGTVERTGYALALYTGQRRADLVKLKWSSIAGDEIRVTQRKTGSTLAIQIHPALAEALAAVRPRREAGILTGEKGKALNAVYFGHIMASAIAAAGLSSKCVLHGLRKATARILAELGMKSAPVTGHLSAQMEREYERDANQRKMAKAAVLKWGRETKKKRARTNREGV